MTINFEKKTIEMTSAESKKAGKYGSKEYDQLVEMRKSFPNYSIVIKSTSSKKDPYKKLTFAYMELFIEKYHKDLLEEFNRKRGIYNGKKQDFAVKENYGEIRAWFLEECPEFKNFIDETSARRERAKEERAKAKIHIEEIPTL